MNEILSGTVERIAFQRVAKGYFILRFGGPNQVEPITVIGAFLHISLTKLHRINGTLFRAHTGHHRTKVLMGVRAIA